MGTRLAPSTTCEKTWRQPSDSSSRTVRAPSSSAVAGRQDSTRGSLRASNCCEITCRTRSRCVSTTDPMFSLLELGLLRRFKQSQRLSAGLPADPTSAERMDVNSRGWQPTEPRPPSCPTLKGSNNMRPALGITSPLLPTRTARRIVRPFQGRAPAPHRSVGFTHGYSHCSPPVNGCSASSLGHCPRASRYLTRSLAPSSPVKAQT